MSRTHNRLVAAAILAVLASCAAQQRGGHGSGSISAASTVDRSRCNEQGHRSETADLNRDGKADEQRLYAGGDLVCIMSDLNFDGRYDLFKHLSGERVLLVESDLDFDQRIDLTSIYEGGVLQREELDTTFDGKPDIWKHYQGGALVRLERDRDGDGTVDHWEQYRDGKLRAVGVDKDADGQPESWVEQGAAPAERQAAAADTARDAQPSPEEPAEDEANKP